MSTNKYSIDEILREAAKIRGGENFSYGYGDSKRSGTVDQINSSLERPIHIDNEIELKPKKEPKSKSFVPVSNNGKSVVMATKKVSNEESLPKMTKKQQEEVEVLSILDDILRNKPKKEEPVYSARKKEGFSSKDVNEKIDGKTIQMDTVVKKEKIESFSATNRKFDKTIEMSVVSEKTPVVNTSSFIKTEEKFSALDTEIIPITDSADYTDSFKTNVQKPEEKQKRNLTPPSPAKSKFKKAENINSQKTRFVEKPAAIKIDADNSQKTGGFKAIPTIVSVDEYQTHFNEYSKPKKSPEYPINDGLSGMQLTLDGKDNIEEPIEKIDEEVAENELHKRREKKIGSFKLFGLNDDIDTQKPTQSLAPIDDYDHPNDKDSIWQNLKLKQSKLSIKLIATTVVTFITGILSLLFSKDMLSGVLSEHYVFMSVMSVLLLVLLILNSTTLLNGIKGLFKWKIDFDFPITFAALIIIIQHTLAFIFPNIISESTPIYTFALGFSMIFNLLGKYEMVKRIMRNFKFLTKDGKKFTVQTIENGRDVKTISRGLLMDSPVIKHSVSTDFPTDFLDVSYKYEPADKSAKNLSPFMIGFSVLIGIITYFVTKDWMVAFTTVCCSSIISIPIVSLWATNTALLSMSKEIEDYNAMVVGFEGAREIDNADAIIIDSSDLFPNGTCGHHGWIFSKGVNIVDALLQTAAVIINTNSPLSDIFDKMIVGKQSILPDIDTVVYEERMGTSAWIYGKKVLVGNRQLLLQHGIKGIPTEQWEAKRTKDGQRQLLYLAVDGKTAAVYSVSYSADEEIKSQLHKLQKSKITVLIKSSDPFITEDMLCEKFDLEPGFIRVLNSSSGRVYEKYENISSGESPAYAVTDGSAKSFISAMYAANTLLTNKNIFSIFQIFGCVLGLAVVGLLGAFNSLGQLGPMQLVLFQTIWSALVMAIAKYKK